MDRYQQLKTALDRYNSAELREYLGANHTDDIKADILRLLKERTSAPQEENDFKAFTMAAMQGLCATGKLNTFQLATNYEGAATDIAFAAISVARATITELSKQQ